MKGFVDNIEALTEENNDFRRVLYTGHNLQLVLMRLSRVTKSARKSTTTGTSSSASKAAKAKSGSMVYATRSRRTMESSCPRTRATM